MKFGSLFTGVGGFDLGFERAGMTCAWQVEFDTHCQEVLKEHWKAKLYGDVREVGRHNLEPVELICGGFPCQDLSVAGKRAGFSGERSSLWFEFARIIDEMRPKWVVIENVPGLLSSAKGQDFETLIRQMDEFGYGVAWRVLDSQNFGVAQRRRRVFIVGSLGNMRCAEVLFESEGLPRDTEESGKEREGITTVSGKDTYPTITSSQSKKKWLGNQEAFTGDYYIGSDEQVNASIIKNCSPTIKSSGGKAILYKKNIFARLLTPTECCRLQGFPDDWNASQSDTQRYKQMGNAVTVNVIEWIGNRILTSQE